MSAGWSPPTIALHWTSAALTLVLLAVGGYMVHGSADAAETFDLYQLHKSLGFAGLALLAARLAGRALTAAPEPAPAPLWQRHAARATHLALYLLLLVGFVSGWLVVSSAIVAVPSRFFDLFVIPNLPGVGPAQFALAKRLHFLSVWALAVLVVLHAGAALKHHGIDRDDVLARMLPWGNGRG